MRRVTRTMILLGIVCAGGMGWAQVVANSVLDVQPELGLDFGWQQTGGSSDALLVSISNEGSDETGLDVTGFTFSGDHAGDFSLVAGGDCPATSFTLAVGEICTQGIEFYPSSDGLKEASLTVESDADVTSNDSVPLEGEGVPTDASLTVDPQSFNFGALDVDAPLECTNFTLGNTQGVDSLTINTAAVAAPFTISGDCNGFTLGGGESCVVEVCFDPQAEGAYSESLTVSSDANDVAATVEGEGTAESDVSVDPPFGPLDLGVGDPGELITFNASATNDGSADAEMSCAMAGDTAVISTDPGPLAGTVPAGGGSLDFSLQCDLPEDGGGGEEYTATLACDIDGEPAGEHVITCGISTLLTIDPDFFDFMELDIDAPAVCETFTLAATPGDDPLTIGTAAVPAPFSVTDNCDGVTLGASVSCGVEVCFDPQAEGTFSESLTVSSDANDVAATVEGEGTAESDVSVDPPFGPVDLGVSDPGELITFNASATNDGSADAEMSCAMAGDTAVISTDPGPLAGTVPAGGGSLDFSLQCDLPEDGGGGEEYTATLACDIDGEPAGEYVVACGISAFEPPRPVPTMQVWAMALFALLMLLAGGIGIRYFRTG